VKVLVKTIHSVLRDEMVEEHLYMATRNACECVLVAKALIEGREDPTQKVVRLFLEARQLPELLKEPSSFFELKQIAANHLKNGHNEQALDIYKQASKLLEPELQRTDLTVLAIRKTSEEAGKISATCR
jgi:hypothetical protein